MKSNQILENIRKNLFYGSSNYTKNQPDFFVPHHFNMLAPSEANSFLDDIIASFYEQEILLYIHLPFCFSECLFCNSFPQKTDGVIQRQYLEYLLKEIELFRSFGIFSGKKVKCIYFGGGTPTSYSNSDIRKIVFLIKSCIDFSDDCSITTEAHPLTLDSERRIFDLSEIGFTRLSVGCQTFDPTVLSLCNRINTPSQIEKIVKSAHRVGLTVNVDMMTGLPGQSIEMVKKDLDILGEIHPDSVEYIRHEIVNPHVADLYRSNPELLVNDDSLFEMIYLTQEWMERNGYEQNGTFTNDTQWGYRYHWLREMPIIAFGTRTRSVLKNVCYDKHEELAIYSRLIDKGIPPIGRYITLTKRERMYRSLILSLQLKSGLYVEQFNENFGESPYVAFDRLIKKLSDMDCLICDVNSIRLSRYGAFFVEDVCDLIIDTALHEKSERLERVPHSGGQRFAEFCGTSNRTQRN